MATMRFLCSNDRKLFAFQDFLDIVEFVEGFKRRQRIHVKMENFVAYLAQDGVIELEETQLLHTFVGTGVAARARHIAPRFSPNTFQFHENLFGTLHDALRHTG